MSRAAGVKTITVRVGVACAVVAGLGLTGSRLPEWLRGLDAFRVAQAEVVGTRYLAPHEAVATIGLGPSASLFDDTRTWVSALRTHPLVDDVKVRRRWPGTLVVEVTEVEPVGLVRTPALRAVDAAGRILPIELAGHRLDLPILGPLTGTVDDDARLGGSVAALLSGYVTLRSFEPGLASRVSEVRDGPGGAVVLRLLDPAHVEIWLPPLPDAERLRQLRGAIADLDARGELRRVRRIDARFRDQVVVSLSTASVS